MGDRQRRAVFAAFDRIGITGSDADRPRRLALASLMLGKPVETFANVTRQDGFTLTRIATDIETGRARMGRKRRGIAPARARRAAADDMSGRDGTARNARATAAQPGPPRRAEMPHMRPCVRGALPGPRMRDRLVPVQHRSGMRQMRRFRQ
jgi:hypothetical protein